MSGKITWWTMETFKFIQTAFPNVKVLCLTGPIEESDFNYYASPGDIRYPEIFSDDFFSNTVIQLPSVTKVRITVQFLDYHNEIFRYLFHLLPNLISI
jgi:hypothetical protein